MTGTSPLAALHDVRRALARHNLKSLTFFLAIAAAAAAATVLLPKEYRSEGKLFVRLGRENSTLDPTATLTQEPVVNVPQSRDNEINSIVEMLRSRALLEKVVERFGVPRCPGRGGTTLGWRGSLAIRLVAPGHRRSARGRPPGPSIAAEARRLEGARSARDGCPRPHRPRGCLGGPQVEHRRVVVQGAVARAAQAVAGKLIELYLEEHARMNRPRRSLEFFVEQTERSRRDLARGESELRDLKTATGLTSPPDQRQSLVKRIARLEDELLDAESARAVSASRCRTLRQELAGLPDRHVVSQTAGVGNEGTDRMRDQLYALEVRKEEAASKLTGEHPRMQQIEGQLAASRAIVNVQEPTRTHVVTATNRLHEETHLSLLQEEPVLAALQAKAVALGGQLAAVRSELKDFNENELRIANLQREIELDQANYRKYSANLEQARIDQALEDQRISNISVFQPASYEPKPVRPRKMIILLLGLATGLFGAVATALVAEQLDHRLRTPDDVERKLDLPVLGTVPRLRAKRFALHANGRK